jgi:hypothetical protein
MVTSPLDVVTLTLCTYAAAPCGIVSCKERASNPSTVTVVLVPRYRLCTVYLGIIGETMRSSLEPGTFCFGSVSQMWYGKGLVVSCEPLWNIALDGREERTWVEAEKMPNKPRGHRCLVVVPR